MFKILALAAAAAALAAPAFADRQVPVCETIVVATAVMDLADQGEVGAATELLVGSCSQTVPISTVNLPYSTVDTVLVENGEYYYHLTVHEIPNGFAVVGLF